MRQINNSFLLCLAFFIILSWAEKTKWEVLPYTLAIFFVGLILHFMKVLGAGDTKLMCVISLGVSEDLLVLFIFFTIFIGGLFALVYLTYGFFTNLELAKQRGLPYAVPISISGGAMILLSHIS